MTTEISPTVEIESSPAKLVVLLAMGLLLTAGGIAILILPVLDHGTFRALLVYLGVLFFAFCTLLAAWRLVMTRGPVITITPDGIRDTRVAPQFIPWTAVTSISTWQMANQKVMVVAVDPAVERTLTLTAIARWSRGGNRALGADGLCMTAAGLKVDYDTLFATALRYAIQGNPGMMADDLVVESATIATTIDFPR
jgi:hypothetical protein